jgi:hypothetical protein
VLPHLAYALLVLLPAQSSGKSDATKPPPAKVVLTGKGAGFMKWSTSTTTVGADGKPATTKVELTLSLFDLGQGQKLAVALPSPPPRPTESQESGGADPDLKRLLARMEDQGQVAVEGTLSHSADPLVAAFAGAAGAKRVPILLATKETRLSEANRKLFPPGQQARVEGVLVFGDAARGAEKTRWSVRDGTGSIALQLPEQPKPPAAGVRVSAQGTVRIVEGRFVVTVTEFSTIK